MDVAKVYGTCVHAIPRLIMRHKNSENVLGGIGKHDGLFSDVGTQFSCVLCAIKTGLH